MYLKFENANIFKFIADGVFSAELNNFLRQELSKEGYSGLELRVVPPATEITILATRTADLIGNQARKFDLFIFELYCFSINNFYYLLIFYAIFLIMNVDFKNLHLLFKRDGNSHKMEFV